MRILIIFNLFLSFVPGNFFGLNPLGYFLFPTEGEKFFNIVRDPSGFPGSLLTTRTFCRHTVPI